MDYCHVAHEVRCHLLLYRTSLTIYSYLDRINVSNARLAGMQEDIGMTDVQWSAGISLFYVGYIISQIPANILIAKGSPRILLPAIMMGWSVATICMPACTRPWHFMSKFSAILNLITRGELG